MTFQTSNLKENQYLELLDDSYHTITSTYIKRDFWINQFDYLNFLYAKATRVITNHISIRKYCLRFFPRENFNCLYKLYPIES